MRKQTEFAYRQIEYSSIEPSKSSPAWSAWIKENYLDQGWEILNTEVVRAEANSVFLGISFVKYETVADEIRSVEVSARRGRPPKVVEEVAGATG